MVGRFIAARALHFAGDLEKAAERFKSILTDFPGLPHNEAVTRTSLAEIAARLGRHRDALTHYATALVLLLELGEKLYLAASLEGIAGAFTQIGRPLIAVRLLGAAASLRAAIGTPPLPADLANLERYRSALVAALGAVAYADVFAAGQGLSPAVAVAEAVAAAQLLQLGEVQVDRAVALSPREREVLRLLVAGLSDKEIGESPGFRRRTAAYHVAAIRAKLDAPRTAAAAIAVRDGLV